MPEDDAISTIGVRELRNQVAAVVRRAAAGERIVISVDGHPTAQLGPLTPIGAPTIDDLVAAGLLIAPQRPERPAAGPPIDTPIDLEITAVIDDLRGRGR